MPMLIRYLGTHLAFSFGITLLLNWAILWYDPDLLTLGNYGEQSDENGLTQAVDCRVVVGVLSARENVRERRAIRDTWWSTPHSDYDVTRCRRFIVGNESCPIHPTDRSSVYDCHLWEVNANDVLQESTVHLFGIVKSGQRSAQKNIYTAFSFNVHHPIVVSKLGVLTGTSGRSTVVLEDAVSKEVVARVTIDGDLRRGVVAVGGFTYRAIEPVLLPTGFEGSVVLETDGELDGDDVRIGYDAAGGVITFQHVTKNDGTFDVFDERMVVAASFAYNVHDVEGLKRKLVERPQRQAEWSQKVETDAKILEEEMNEQRDIIIVDVLDVYRNLVWKLLAFYDWVSKAYNYDVVVKADDDTLLDMERIERHLKSSSNSKRTWWGRFRQYWAVQRHGKWKELSYRSVSYPPFACGTAYALSSDLIVWLAANRNFLERYQGEDVSMGIWMAAVGHEKAHDTRWQCSDECIDLAFSRGQLEPSLMRTAWKSLTQCGNICKCT